MNWQTNQLTCREYMNDTQHISETEFLKFKQNRMNQQERGTFLKHICTCNYCSDQLAALMTDEIIAAPSDMKANILRAVKRPEVQLAIKVKETSKQMQLFLYSLKVGTATVGALLLLLFMVKMPDLTNTSGIFYNNPASIENDSSIEENSTFTDAIRDGMNSISKNMLDFSNNIMKTEVTKNDQKER